MTIRAADDFGAIARRLRELEGAPNPAPAQDLNEASLKQSLLELQPEDPTNGWASPTGLLFHTKLPNGGHAYAYPDRVETIYVDRTEIDYGDHVRVYPSNGAAPYVMPKAVPTKPGSVVVPVPTSYQPPPPEPIPVNLPVSLEQCMETIERLRAEWAATATDVKYKVDYRALTGVGIAFVPKEEPPAWLVIPPSHYYHGMNSEGLAIIMDTDCERIYAIPAPAPVVADVAMTAAAPVIGSGPTGSRNLACSGVRSIVIPSDTWDERVPMTIADALRYETYDLGLALHDAETGDWTTENLKIKHAVIQHYGYCSIGK